MPSGYLLLILHAHLPYVRHPEFDRFLEERWFFEAVTETYVPFDQVLRPPEGRGHAVQADTLGLADVGEHDGRPAPPRAVRAALRHAGRAGGTRDRADAAVARCQLPRHDVPEHLRGLAPDLRGAVPDSTGLGFPGARRVRAPGADDLRRHTRLPAAAQLRAGHRAGAGAGVVARASADFRLTAGGDVGSGVRLLSRPRRASGRGGRALLRGRLARASSTPTHGRCSASTPRCIAPPGWRPSGGTRRRRKLVWSNKVGYPADLQLPRVLPRHRLRARPALPRTLPVRQGGPDAGGDQVPPDHRAGTRTSTCTTRTGPGTPPSATPGTSWTAAATRPCAPARGCRSPRCIVSPYDAELFGHWWFEGPQWIYHVLRELAHGGPLAGRDAGGYLAAHPIQQCAMPAPRAGAATATANTGSTRGPT